MKEQITYIDSFGRMTKHKNVHSLVPFSKDLHLCDVWGLKPRIQVKHLQFRQLQLC